MLEKSRFLAIKNLARDIRHENEKLFKAFENESVEDVIREKSEFIESVVDSMEIAFSDGDQGKEEKQIFRANVLIPDDLDFFNAYSSDKNIRNLMNKYAVSIEDVMSKITELNLYGKYIDLYGAEKDVDKSSEEDSEKSSDEASEVTEISSDIDEFVDEMVNLSSKEAESLLDEIEGLSSVMDELEIPKEEEEVTPVALDENIDLNIVDDEIVEEEVEEVEEKPAPKKPKASKKEDTSSEVDDDFENMSEAVFGFVDEYSKTQEDLEKANEEASKLKDKVSKLEDELAELKKSNLESANALNEIREEKELINNENIELKEQLKAMEAKAVKSAELIKKIYNSIPKK